MRIKLAREIKAKSNEGVELSRRIQQAKNAKETYKLTQELAQITGEMEHLVATLAATTSISRGRIVAVS